MALGTGLMAVVVGMGLSSLGVWKPLDRAVYNRLFLVRDRLSETQWDDRVVVIAIDDASLATYGPYPWSRDHYAALLDRLMAVQPAAIGFDILMPEATAEDALLAESILFSGNVVLAASGDGQGNAIQVSPTITEPADGFLRVGHVKHSPDSDGISRQAFLYERHQDEVAPSLAIALLATYQQSLDNLLTTDAIVPTKTNPTFLADPSQFDQTKPLWINWPGLTRPQSNLDPQSTHGITTLSLTSVMDENNTQALDQLHNKIVLVGYTAVGVVGEAEDPLRTPFEQNIPTAGVYFHAAILDNLLNDRFLRQIPGSLTLVLVTLSGLGSSLILKHLGSKSRLVFVLGLLPAWFTVAYVSFLNGLLLPISAPIGTGLLGVMIYQLLEQRERQTLMDLFAINLSPQMADFIWQHKEELLNDGHIHSQELTATLLFTDIRGFTTITEQLPSDVLLPWLNRYFEVMTDCIMAHGGVVDKYIGDAIMAAFGAPIARPGEDAIRQDALAAVMASVAMVERLESLNQEFEAQELPTIQFGIGLHTGPLVAGTVGSRNRANYSLFGDTVNTAARLQDMTKQLTQGAPYPILMSDATYGKIDNRCAVFPKGQIQLRGRTTETIVYALDKFHSQEQGPRPQASLAQPDS